jgi:hypothetical protein
VAKSRCRLRPEDASGSWIQSDKPATTSCLAFYGRDFVDRQRLYSRFWHGDYSNRVAHGVENFQGIAILAVLTRQMIDNRCHVAFEAGP